MPLIILVINLNLNDVIDISRSYYYLAEQMFDMGFGLFVGNYRIG